MPNPFNQGDYEFMPLPPPKKKSAPPARPNRNYDRAEPRQNGLRFQPNQLFESEEEIKTWMKFSYPNDEVILIKTWKIERFACCIEIRDKPKK